MSEDTAKSRKAKKAERDAARRQGGKKRKAAEDEVPNLPGDDQEEDETKAQPSLDKNANTKSKKRKHDSENGPEDGGAGVDESTSTQPKRKRAKKPGAASTGEEGAANGPTKSRFIVFVGNLPYSTTDVSLQAHFAKLEPFTLRHRTDPKTKKSKGFAFLEFENYDRMKTCLKLYHHSMFDPDDKANGGTGKPGGRGGRRINVELTAGGGGKTEGRKEKIRVKNQRLEDQRKRRAEQEQKTEERQAAKKGTKTQPAAAAANESNQGIHPSRLAQMGR